MPLQKLSGLNIEVGNEMPKNQTYPAMGRMASSLTNLSERNELGRFSSDALSTFFNIMTLRKIRDKDARLLHVDISIRTSRLKRKGVTSCRTRTNSFTVFPVSLALTMRLRFYKAKSWQTDGCTCQAKTGIFGGRNPHQYPIQYSAALPRLPEHANYWVHGGVVMGSIAI